jgi:hypothetical protein
MTDTNVAAAVTETATEPGFLPSEVWGIVFKHGKFSGKDLKSLRLVNLTLREYSTPLLFDKAVFAIGILRMMPY